MPGIVSSLLNTICNVRSAFSCRLAPVSGLLLGCNFSATFLCVICFDHRFLYLLRCIDDPNVVSKLQRSQDGGEDGQNEGSGHRLEEKHTKAQGVKLLLEMWVQNGTVRHSNIMQHYDPDDITDHSIGSQHLHGGVSTVIHDLGEKWYNQVCLHPS